MFKGRDWLTKSDLVEEDLSIDPLVWVLWNPLCLLFPVETLSRWLYPHLWVTGVLDRVPDPEVETLGQIFKRKDTHAARNSTFSLI